MPKFLTDVLQKLSKSTLTRLPDVKHHRDGIEFQSGWSFRLSNFNPLNPFYNAAYFSKWILSCASNLKPKYVLGLVSFAYQFTRVESATIVPGFLLKDKMHFVQLLPARGNYDGASHFEGDRALATSINGTQSDYYLGNAKIATCDLYKLDGLDRHEKNKWMIYTLAGVVAVPVLILFLTLLYTLINEENQNIRRNDIEDDRPIERNQLERQPERPPNRKISQIVLQQNFKNRLKQLKTQCHARDHFLAEIQKFEERYQCPISYSVMNNPITLPTGHTYDLRSLLNWFRAGGKKCPNSNVKLANTKNLKSSYKIKTLMEEDLSTLEKNIERELKNETSVSVAPYKCRRMYF